MMDQNYQTYPSVMPHDPFVTPDRPMIVPGPEGALGVLESLHKVMDEIKAVGKEGYNAHSKYNFRGIDGVMNAVGPALRKHGTLLVPTVEQILYGQVQSKSGQPMSSVKLRMRVSVIAKDGSSIASVVWGEAFDSGDKATAKAHSVALRTALLEMLVLPTQEPDPDETTYEQGNPHASNEELLTQAEQVTAMELTRMVNQAQQQGNRELYDALIAVGRRRFPPTQAGNQSETSK